VTARTTAARKDWLRYLYYTELNYWSDMRSVIKGRLEARALVVGTIVGTSLPSLMADFDAVDSHAYWRHPEFPGTPWDGVNWFVRNDAMVNDQGGSTVVDLAMKRVLGKPHLVTEYNHPSPNSFEAEAYPFLATYASLQDFDAVFAFDYAGDRRWDERRIFAACLHLLARGRISGIDVVTPVVSFEQAVAEYPKIATHPEQYIKLGVAY
jgi:hypothetical protein